MLWHQHAAVENKDSVMSTAKYRIQLTSGVISDLFRNHKNIREMLNQVQHDIAATISPLTQH